MFSGIFSMFGRSRELQQLDRELGDASLHPALVPEPVKLTELKLLKEVGPGHRRRLRRCLGPFGLLHTRPARL